jgi:gas vesicle protein
MPGQIGGTLSALSIMAAMNPGGAASGLLGSMGLMSGLAGTLFAAAGPALMAFGLGQNFGPLGGALAGAGAGFGMGALIGLAGGPIGALIGGIVGAIAGLFGGLFGGSKRKKQANNYFDQQIAPQIKQIEDAYKSFQLDFTTANSQLEQLRSQAKDQLSKLKGEGKDVFKKKVSPAIDQAEKEISQFETERQRRAGLVFGPPQFHDGGLVQATMSAWVTKPGEMLSVLKHGEFVVNPQDTARNLPALQRMNSGGTAGLPAGITVNGGINLYPSQLDRRYVQSGQFMKDVVSALQRAGLEGHL